MVIFLNYHVTSFYYCMWMTHRPSALTYTQEYTMLPGVVRHRTCNYYFRSFHDAKPVPPPWHKILATPLYKCMIKSYCTGKWFVTDANGREIYCVQTGLAFFKQNSVNKIAFIMVFIYRPRRDGRLSRPWCELAQAEIRTCNLTSANPACTLPHSH